MQDYRVTGEYPIPQNPDGSIYTRPTSLDLKTMGSDKKKGYSDSLILDKTGGGY